MSNLRAREALERTRQRFIEQPEAAKRPGSGAVAVWRDGLQCEVTGPGGERTVTDMAPAMGGDGTAPSPGWLLRASLAACAATVIAMRAAARGIELRTLEVHVDSESDGRGLAGIAGVSAGFSALRVAIRIGADNVPDDALRALARSAHSESPVTCTMRHPPPETVEIAVV